MVAGLLILLLSTWATGGFACGVTAGVVGFEDEDEDEDEDERLSGSGFCQRDMALTPPIPLGQRTRRTVAARRC
jgi:hypothetical protein